MRTLRMSESAPGVRSYASMLRMNASLRIRRRDVIDKAAKCMPMVLPSSPQQQQSPTSPVEPLDLRDIGDLPVKLELRYAIESRRSEKGLDIPVTVVQQHKPKQKMTAEEEERRRIRRQRNKVAASKCRIKRKNHVRSLLKASEDLSKANNKLESEIAHLRKEKDRLVDALRAHLCMKEQKISEKRKRNPA